MARLQIDPERCHACGICGWVCPRHVLVTTDQDGLKQTMVSPERAHLCMECGQCAAVCPQEAIQIEAFQGRAFPPAGPVDISYQQMKSLLARRRSVRRYKDQPIPRAVLDQIVESVHLAPTGNGRMSTGVIIVDRPELLAEMSRMMFDLYAGLTKALANPIGRFMVKKKAGARQVSTLRNFVMPGMHWYMKWYNEGESNEITRDCPVLMLFHSGIDEPSGDENCLVAAFHAVLAAEVLGLGTCLNGLIPPACNRSPDLRRLLALPLDSEVYASLTMGYSKYKFPRTIPRQLAEVRYLGA